MKRSLIILTLTIAALTVSFSDLRYESKIPAPVASKKLDINNISTWFRTNGSFNRDPSTGNAGFEWPKGSGHKDRYASGLWMAAKVDPETLVCLAEYDYEYLPGYVDDNGSPQGLNDPAYRIYSIIRGDTLSQDYQNWPSYQGAYLNAQNKPYFLGTQTMFYSYTDAYPQAHGNNAGSTSPLKVQILQTNWSYTNIGLEDVCFTEYRIINRSQHLWRDAYIGIWTDDDIGANSFDDAYGLDTLRDLGYCYNFDSSDPAYTTNPPAVGFKVLRGPAVFHPGDTAKYYSPPGSANLVVKPNCKLMKVSVYNVFWNSDPTTGDPSNFRETYLCFQGLRSNGTPWINPLTGQPAKLIFTGDPVTGSGWLPMNGPQRNLLIFGPLDMNHNDTQSVIIAQVAARGSNNLNSITKLRELSDHVQTIYDNNFQSVLSSGNNYSSVPNEFTLHQNYPNPFNPSTTIEYELPTSGEVVIIIYDISGREVRRLDEGIKQAGNHKLELNADGLSSGTYLCKAVFSNNTMSTVKSMRLMLIK
ncbi:MAG: T9SS type A sorting domain-containing protein [Ignavibacteria bacterium]|nr:T9SS type A sorting domain-containing protein [Ignavibacteria bacterium]